MLRGGPLAEKRVIELVNARFVPFYFNVGRGTGYDADAAAFIATVDKRFGGRMVPTPPVWVFSPDGETLLGTLDNYLPKDRFFAELRKILAKHPRFDGPNDAQKTLRAAAAESAESSLAVARLDETIGHYADARKRYGTLTKTDGEVGHRAWLGLARIARYEGDTKAAETALAALREAKAFPADVAVETAHAMLASRAWADAGGELKAAIRAWPTSPRLGEMYFYAGVAAFRAGARDWANFFWCWVMENIPEDYNYMRCYLAATADAMIYPNPELGGYRGKSRMISHRLADAARANAMKDYVRIKALFDAGK